MSPFLSLNLLLAIGGQALQQQQHQHFYDNAPNPCAMAWAMSVVRAQVMQRKNI